MSQRSLLLGVQVVLLASCACSRLPGKPEAGPEVPRPDSVLNSAVLYAANCAGCHGATGKYGPAMDLSDPVYLAIVDDDTLRDTISRGRPGTAMSAFSRKQGGMLTDEQINSIIRGIREHWGNPSALAGVTPPSYTVAVTGDPQKGEAAYMTYCVSCHGDNDKGGPKAGSVSNPSYLS